MIACRASTRRIYFMRMIPFAWSLQPGRDDAPLTLRLLNTNLCEAQPYEAVSYVWGDLKDLISINVQGDEDTETQAHISQNCHAALSSFRDSDSPRLLWIDFLSS